MNTLYSQNTVINDTVIVNHQYSSARIWGSAIVH